MYYIYLYIVYDLCTICIAISGNLPAAVDLPTAPLTRILGYIKGNVLLGIALKCVQYRY